MDVNLGRECYVTLNRQNTAIRDIVNEQAELANKARNDSHFYMCDLGDVIDKYQKWVQQMPRVKPFYAVKCNDEFPVLKVLSDLGASFDCASRIEIEKILDLGVSPTRIIYAHPCRQASMLMLAQQKGVDLLTFDNVAELYKVKRIHPAAKLVLRVKIVSEFKGKLDFSSKFGCHPSEALEVLQVAKELGLKVIGISFHVGSDCHESKAFSVAIEQARQVFDIGLELGFRLKLLDIGGGFPGQGNTTETFNEIAIVVKMGLQKYFPPEEDIEIIAEPGRYMVASASTIGVNIIAKRVIPSKLNTNYEDEGATNSTSKDRIMYYVNDGVYGSFLCKLVEEQKYEAQHLKATENAVYYESCVWGPALDSVDCIVESMDLPLHEVGEWLYFQDMGAYSLPMASQFNGMEGPRRVYYSLVNTWYKLYPKPPEEQIVDC